MSFAALSALMVSVKFTQSFSLILIFTVSTKACCQTVDSDGTFPAKRTIAFDGGTVSPL